MQQSRPVPRSPHRDEIQARWRRRSAGTTVASLGLLLALLPALGAVLVGLDSASVPCVESGIGNPCDLPAQAFGAAVALPAVPVVLGLLIARPARRNAYLVTTVAAALALYVALLVLA